MYHANEHGARVRGLDSSGGGILAATLQGRRSRGGPLAKLGEYLDPSRPHRDGEPVASRFLVSRKPILTWAASGPVLPTWEAKRRARETKNGAMAAIRCLPPPLIAWLSSGRCPPQRMSGQAWARPPWAAQHPTPRVRRQRADPARRRPSRHRRGGRGRYARSPESCAVGSHYDRRGGTAP